MPRICREYNANEKTNAVCEVCEALDLLLVRRTFRNSPEPRDMKVKETRADKARRMEYLRECRVSSTSSVVLDQHEVLYVLRSSVFMIQSVHCSFHS